MFTEIAPRMAPHTTGAYFCTFFPAAAEPRIEITGAGAGPIVLCGTTVDASTPLEGTRAMAESLEDGHLIVVDAVSSGCWGASECAEQLITDYLVDLDVPGHGDRLRSQLAGAANAQVSSRRHGPARRDGVAAGGAVDSLTSIVGWKTAPGMRRSVRAINCKARLPAAWPTSVPG